MKSLPYSASARLGVWNTVPTESRKLIDDLARVLKDCSNATIEVRDGQLRPLNGTPAASLLALIDKIVSRGSPTLVDLDYERRILERGDSGLVTSSPHPNDSSLNDRFHKLDVNAPRKRLLDAVQDLIDLPYECQASGQIPIPEGLNDSISEEEQLFYKGFSRFFGESAAAHLRPQVGIEDLLRQIATKVVDERVDFAFRLAGTKFVLEVDGMQHSDSGQRQKDNYRDDLLRRAGWQVMRVPTGEVREPARLDRWLMGLSQRIGKEQVERIKKVSGSTVRDLVASSPTHRTALNAVLRPTAMHRCLRGLVLLFLNQVLPVGKPLRILVIERDLSVVPAAFEVLTRMWTHLSSIVSGAPQMPLITIDVLANGTSETSAELGVSVKPTREPCGEYDLSIDHGFFFDNYGNHERSSLSNGTAVALRPAFFHREARALHKSEGLTYQLEDIDHVPTGDNKGLEEPGAPTSLKQSALLYFLHSIFRKRSFLEGQLPAILRLLQGKPSIVLLPTGAGKSLIFQYSGLLLPGMTIVIDPIVSLMADQVENLLLQGIDAVESISSQIDHQARNRVMERMTRGELAFVFVSPERLQIAEFRRRLSAVADRSRISLAVIDEAHCASEWGHDFRPAYLHLPHNLKKYCTASDGNAPTLVGLTGTASLAVLADVQNEMQISDGTAVIAPQSFDRGELKFDVKAVRASEKREELLELKKAIPQSLGLEPEGFYHLKAKGTNAGIVFCPNARGDLGVSRVASTLGHENYYSGRVPDDFAGRGRDWDEYKQQVQGRFKDDRTQELVATKSFGMGIDKPNVRYTIHYSMPSSIESFYQEAGRAGRDRDDKWAYCAILYSDDNWNQGLRILNENDHERALRLLNSVPRNARGDLLTQLWLLLNSYKGRQFEKNEVLRIWRDHLANGHSSRSGDKETARVPFQDSDTTDSNLASANANVKERFLFRLLLLGVIEDYSVNWQDRTYDVGLCKLSPTELRENLQKYLARYKSADVVKQLVANVPMRGFEKALIASTNILVDFIYDEIVKRRKEGLKHIAEMCRSFRTEDDFRKQILAYFEDSEFSEVLKSWVGRPLVEIGMDAIDQVLRTVGGYEAQRNLIGSARRMLEEDPDNLALRVISACARALHGAQHDAEVLQEVATIAIQVRSRTGSVEDTEVLHQLFRRIREIRPPLTEEVGLLMFRHAGDADFARRFLLDEPRASKSLKAIAATFILANAVSIVRVGDFSGDIKYGRRLVTN